MEIKEILRIEPWMRGLLLLAGFYNLGWGVFINQFPRAFYHWVTMSAKTAPLAIEWHGLGVLLFGVLYIITTIYPYRLWFLLAAGLVSKILGGLWFYFYIMEKNINNRFLFHLIMNDLVWVIPFTVILWRIVKLRSKKEHAV